MFTSLAPLFTDNRFRIIMGSGCIVLGIINGVLYYRDLAMAAQSRSDIRELNQRTIMQNEKPPVSPVVTTSPTPAPSAASVAPTAPLPIATPKPNPTPAVKPTATPVVAATTPSTSGKVKISTATEAEFDTLPGIGPSRAKAIVEYRATTPFTKLEDLKEVPSIGDKTYATLLPLIEL